MSRREILMSLVGDAGRGGLAFPTSTVAALGIHQALDDPDCSTDAIARQIQAEPLLAARVVALANSAAYNRGGKVVTDVKNAVNLLGFRAVKMFFRSIPCRARLPQTPARPHQRGPQARRGRGSG